MDVISLFIYHYENRIDEIVSLRRCWTPTLIRDTLLMVVWLKCKIGNYGKKCQCNQKGRVPNHKQISYMNDSINCYKNLLSIYFYNAFRRRCCFVITKTLHLYLFVLNIDHHLH